MLAREVCRTRCERLMRFAAWEQWWLAKRGVNEHLGTKRDLDRLHDLSPPFPTRSRRETLVG